MKPQQIGTSALRGKAPSVQGEERELYFLSDTGTAKVGHRVEDRQRRVPKIDGLNSFVINGLLNAQKEKVCLTTTGYNQNMIRFCNT